MVRIKLIPNNLNASHNKALCVYILIYTYFFIFLFYLYNENENEMVNTMPDIESKITRHTKSQENTRRNEEKSQRVETKAKVTQMKGKLSAKGVTARKRR